MNLKTDRNYGYTTSGPQKADLSFKFGSAKAAEVLSRGQLKLLIYALKIAQSKLLRESSSRNCVFLIDDLPAELDSVSRQRVCTALENLNDQVFVTCIDEQALTPHLGAGETRTDMARKVFHVKHGTITD